MIGNEENSFNHDTIINQINPLDIEYFFRRTYFVIGDGMLVELVSLASESNEIVGNEEVKGCKVLATDSREISFSELPGDLAIPLAEKEVIKEVFKINNEQQYTRLHKKYKDNLFSVTKEVIDTLN
ncbi:hypothetical protein NC797_07550 [Aquibacillus sp. 3ASR75-11]|uniref:Uncharacterized protein n=1 Tax=Terrihalobacillus insolitus TaxID=2950438 RepID=A0A9X4ANB2_9BACI|nr:hypothetical protein [Terrihalobacillus insolitus]MDC3424360.1 hypothetical protein [Terrihalobacillus insolitus]